MHISPRTRGYLVELSDDERSALVWALELGRALLRREPNLCLLAAEEAVSAEVLDGLADRLFLAGGTRAADE